MVTGAEPPKWRVVVTSEIPPAGLARLQECDGLDLDYPKPGAPALGTEELCAKLREGSDALYCLLTDKITPAVLEAGGERLKIVATMSVGYNHVDTATCARRGIKLTNTPDCLTETTADTTLGLVLAACRRFKEAAAAVENGGWGVWSPEWMCGPDVHHSTVGIVGLGRIGAAVARRLRAFGCTILYSGNRPKPDVAAPLDAEFVDFETLLAKSDIVIPLCPLNIVTRGMFDKSVFAKMKKSAVFINAARGELVNQDDLIAVLKERGIFGAGLDVTTPEPLPLDSELIKLPNCFILPHIGSASLETRGAMARMAADNIVAAYYSKTLPNEVNIK